MIKITDKFTSIDGTEGVRSKMDDFQTLSHRFLIRIKEAIGNDNKLIELLDIAFTNYNHSNFEKAKEYLEAAIKQQPVIEAELEPFISICKRVVASPKTADDLLYENFLEEVRKWNNRYFLSKIFRPKPKYAKGSVLSSERKVRCKYCGHYTSYINPNEGFAYLSQNNCENCKRGYPVACVEWDNMDGQAYIYYRNSVTEDEFYDEFEKKYIVSPGRDFFLAKSK